MNITDLRYKNIDELNKYLISLYRDKFKLLLEKTSKPGFSKRGELKKVKKNIARTLTLITESEKKYEKK